MTGGEVAGSTIGACRYAITSVISDAITAVIGKAMMNHTMGFRCQSESPCGSGSRVEEWIIECPRRPVVLAPRIGIPQRCWSVGDPMSH